MSDSQNQLEKILVICIDKDNDIENKAGIETPIIGREKCIDAAIKLSLEDPEEADSNAIFAAIKQYDNLAAKNHECEVAIIGGTNKGGLEADLKVRDDIREVLQKFKADGLVLVSDGIEDEKAIPIIQSIVPIISVIRVIVKQSKTVEDTYALLGRYLRMLAFDTRFSRIALGIPGLILLMWGIAVFFEQEKLAVLIALGLIGITLLIRGFDLDKMKPSGYLRVFSIVSSALVILTAFYIAFLTISTTTAFQMVKSDINLIWSYGPFLAGKLIQESINLLWIGMAIFFLGGALINYIKGSVKMLGSAVVLVILALLYVPVLEFSQILTGAGNATSMVSYLLLGFAVVFLIATSVYMYVQSRRGSK